VSIRRLLQCHPKNSPRLNIAIAQWYQYKKSRSPAGGPMGAAAGAELSQKSRVTRYRSLIGKALGRVASETWSRLRSRLPNHRIEVSESRPLPADSSSESNTTHSSSLLALRESYTTNTSFISTDSSLQSYYTPNASVSTINSTSSCSSDVSFPHTVTSINSRKSRKTVLYRRREHPPPAAISSKELSETPHLM